METGKTDDGLFAMGPRGGTVHHGNDGIFAGAVAGFAAIVDGGVRVPSILLVSLVVVVALVLASLVVVVALVLASVPLLVYPEEAGGRGRELKAAEPH